MSRIQKTFEKLGNQKALNIFITAGFPNKAQSLEILKSLPDAGADLIELGIPFTDPMADGPTIQDSSLVALENGMSLQGTLDMLSEFRQTNNETPVILMGYFNPIYAYGCDAFVTAAAKAGADGLIVVDLPPEEDEELRIPAQEAGIDFIKLVTPTTIGTRLDKVIENASGFLYYVSIAGVTGTKSADIDKVGAHIVDIKAKTPLPVAVGFGIKTPDDAQNMSKIADAVVVGSAVVETIKDNQASNDIISRLKDQISALKNAI
jgi:tryptophan synthase alpha chain